MAEARILVVDDEPQIRRVLHSTLVTAGYEVVDAGSGRAALEALRAGSFDLVLLDINMPDLDGLETCRIIRSGSDVSIIMLTVRNTEKDKIDSLDAGADDYVTKPFSTQELLARIRAALRRTPFIRDTSGTVIKVDAMEIHLAKRKVVVGGVSVRLTPKEFDLLHYLMAHTGLPITHARLLSAVWGAEYVNQVEYLRTFVRQLRKKLEDDAGSPKYILTDSYVGYRFLGNEATE